MTYKICYVKYVQGCLWRTVDFSPADCHNALDPQGIQRDTPTAEDYASHTAWNTSFPWPPSQTSDALDPSRTARTTSSWPPLLLNLTGSSASPLAASATPAATVPVPQA